MIGLAKEARWVFVLGPTGPTTLPLKEKHEPVRTTKFHLRISMHMVLLSASSRSVMETSALVYCSASVKILYVYRSYRDVLALRCDPLRALFRTWLACSRSRQNPAGEKLRCSIIFRLRPVRQLLSGWVRACAAQVDGASSIFLRASISYCMPSKDPVYRILSVKLKTAFS